MYFAPCRNKISKNRDSHGAYRIISRNSSRYNICVRININKYLLPGGYLFRLLPYIEYNINTTTTNTTNPPRYGENIFIIIQSNEFSNNNMRIEADKVGSRTKYLFF